MILAPCVPHFPYRAGGTGYRRASHYLWGFDRASARGAAAHERLNVSPLRNVVAKFASDSLTLERAIQTNDGSGEAKGIQALRSDRHAVESQIASGHARVGKNKWNEIALTLDQLQGQIVRP
jgi:hypothetical protein